MTAALKLTNIFRRHGCGAEFTREEWDALEELDPQDGGGAEINGRPVHYWIELRQCGCGSTLAQEWNTIDHGLELSGLLQRMVTR